MSRLRTFCRACKKDGVYPDDLWELLGERNIEVKQGSLLSPKLSGTPTRTPKTPVNYKPNGGNAVETIQQPQL